MAFYDELQKNVKEAASFTAKKATELSSIAKLKINIRGEEGKLEKCYSDIGRLFYESDKDGKDYAEEIGALVRYADTINEKINGYKTELSKLKKVNICTDCGIEFSNEFSFCPGCGKKAEEKAEDDTEAEN